MKKAKKVLIIIVTMVIMFTALSISASANNTGEALTAVTTPVINLLNTIFGIAIPVVGAVGSIFCIFLGLKLAKAEEPQDREKAKNALKNAIIGFVLIFVLVVALRIGIPIMEQWVADNTTR